MLGLVNLQITVHQSLAGNVRQCTHTRLANAHAAIRESATATTRKTNKKAVPPMDWLLRANTHYSHPIWRQPAVRHISTALATAHASHSANQMMASRQRSTSDQPLASEGTPHLTSHSRGGAVESPTSLCQQTRASHTLVSRREHQRALHWDPAVPGCRGKWGRRKR